MENWQPTSIISINKVLGGSSSPFLVTTDTNDTGVLKLPSECDHVDALVCEYVGSRLAQMLGIPIPDFCCIKTDSAFEEAVFELYGTIAAQSYGFLSRFENARTPKTKSILEINNVSDITKIIFLDTWIRNPDRHLDNSPNWKNLLLVNINENEQETTILKIIDQERAFRFHSLEIDVSAQAVCDERIFGLFDEFKKVIDIETIKDVSTKLRSFSKNEIEPIFLELPLAWQVDSARASEIIDFILRRALFISETLPEKLLKLSSNFNFA